MIVLFHAIWYIITELLLPAWQKEARDITYQVIKAMEVAKKFVTFRMKYFVLHTCINKLEFACQEYLISFQKHVHSKPSCASHRLHKTFQEPLLKNSEQPLLSIQTSHFFNTK